MMQTRPPAEALEDPSRTGAGQMTRNTLAPFPRLRHIARRPLARKAHPQSPFRLDGRWLAAGAPIVFFAIVVVLHTADGSIWRVAGVSPLTPNFADARVITSGWECTNKGYDVLVENPCDPWYRPMNYPRFWLVPAALHFDQTATAALGVSFAVLFYVSSLLLLGRLGVFEGLFSAAVFVSPPVLLAIERGNNDLLIFTFLAISLLAWRFPNRVGRAVGLGFVFLAAIAKLYPILALVALLGRRTRNANAALASLLIGAGFAIYVALTFHDLVLVSHATPRVTVISYGANVLLDAIYSAGPTQYMWAQGFVGLLLRSSAIVIALALALYIATSRSQQFRHFLEDNYGTDAFMVGAAIYVGTFLVGNNFNYRLIFLVFTVPCLFVAVRHGNKAARWMLEAVIVMLFLTRFQAPVSPLLFVGDQLLEWGLFVVLVAALWTYLDVGSWYLRSSIFLGKLTRSQGERVGG